MRINLQWKLTFIICGIIIFVLAALYSYINTHLKNYLEQRIQYSLKRELVLSKDMVEDELSTGRASSNIDALADRIEKSLNLRVTIIGPDGSIKGDSEMDEKDFSSAENHLSRPEIQSALKNGFGQSNRFSTTRKTNMLYMAMPLGEKTSMGYLRLSMPLSDIESIVTKMRKIITASIFSAVILTLVLGYMISLMISKPLREMSSVARQLAKGDFSKKAYIHSGDEIGDLAAALNYMSDEIKNKMTRISYEEAKIDAVISSMFEGVILTDEKGQILMMNPALRKLFLVDAPPEGKRPIEIMRNNRVQDIVDKIIGEEKRITTEETLTNLPGEKVIRINGAPVIRKGKMEGAILVFHDITELRRLEKVRQDFVANVSHELRTPLSNIKGYAETLLHGALEDKINAKDFTSIIFRESDRLAKLLDDLLDLSKIESGKMKIVFMPTNLGNALTRVFEILKKSADDKRIKIEMAVPKDIPKVLADESRLTQVMLNLLDNAIKFTPENGSIKISASKTDGFVRTDINDTGVGIPDKDLPRIFERFYRVDKAHSRELGGTGLGLSIVKHIVQSHGGDVWVKSALGEGSTFSFTIPAA